MILAIIVAAIWITSFVITELLFALYELWKRRQQVRRAIGELIARKNAQAKLLREGEAARQSFKPGKA